RCLAVPATAGCGARCGTAASKSTSSVAAGWRGLRRSWAGASFPVTLASRQPARRGSICWPTLWSSISTWTRWCGWPPRVHRRACRWFKASWAEDTYDAEVEPRSEVTLAQVRAAAGRIADLAIRTPVVFSDALSENVGNDVWLKLETHQPTGAFKIRGASNRILRLSEEQRRRGVLAASTGNHGRAVAYVARELGIDAVIAVSRLVPDNKLQAIRDLGAELVIAGEDQEDAMRAVTER